MASKEWNVKQCLDWTSEYLDRHGIERPRLSAEWLLTAATGLSRVGLYTSYDKPLDEGELSFMHQAIVRRAKGEPLQYITGETSFRMIDVACEPGVLIPRPETEVLVEEVLAFLDREVLGAESSARVPRAELPWNAEVEAARKAEAEAARERAAAAAESDGGGAVLPADEVFGHVELEEEPAGEPGKGAGPDEPNLADELATSTEQPGASARGAALADPEQSDDLSAAVEQGDELDSGELSSGSAVSALAGGTAALSESAPAVDGDMGVTPEQGCGSDAAVPASSSALNEGAATLSEPIPVADNNASAPAPAPAVPAHARVLEVGCGTGCISLSIATERAGRVTCIATDIEPRAVALANKNRERLGVAADVVDIRLGNLVSPLDREREWGTFDVLVSNPPYIPSSVMAELPHEVVDFEPSLALEGGTDGLDIFRRLLKAAPYMLRPGGLFACELFEGSLETAAALCSEAGMDDVRIVRDLTDRPRIVLARTPAP